MYPKRNGRQGFTLVVTLILLMLLTVLCVGMLTLATVSLRGASQDQAAATARANARLGIMLAIGDLQKSLGRDQAITAPSELVAGGTGRGHLTGVWSSWDLNPAQAAPNYQNEKAKRFQTWLVSSANPAAVRDRAFVNNPQGL